MDHSKKDVLMIMTVNGMEVVQIDIAQISLILHPQMILAMLTYQHALSHILVVVLICNHLVLLSLPKFNAKLIQKDRNVIGIN